MKKDLLVATFALLALPITADNVNYCHSSLCKPHLPHIACENSGAINRTCASSSEIIKLSPAIKANIIRKHNEYRSQLALGKVPNFPPAKRMATMQWHDELAKLADLNVKTCTGTHDYCRNTFNFTHSGQNIARRTLKSGSFTRRQIEENIYHGIDRWFREHSICSNDNALVYNSRMKECGHFTLMIAERNTHLGCAVILMRGEKTVFTCNYAWTNMRKQKMYTPGRNTSGCASGGNREYPGLCSINETYSSWNCLGFVLEVKWWQVLLLSLREILLIILTKFSDPTLWRIQRQSKKKKEY